MTARLLALLLVCVFLIGCIATANVPKGEYSFNRSKTDSGAVHVDVGVARVVAEVDLPGSLMVQQFVKDGIRYVGKLFGKVNKEVPVEGK